MGTTIIMDASSQRHRFLHAIVPCMYALPFSRYLIRHLVRFLLQHSPLSVKNKQRLYNFFAQESGGSGTVVCSTHVANASAVRLRLDLQDDLSRTWYFWGYSGYEQGTIRVFRELLRTKTCVFDIGANIGYYTLLA